MWSWQNLHSQYQTLSQDQDADHLILGKQYINMGIKKLEIELGMPPMEEERSITTTTSDSYALPERFISLDELYVTVSSVRHYADPVYDNETWGFYKRNSGTTSDILRNVFVRPGLHTFEIYPTPANAGNTMKMLYKAFSKDLSADDYTTGTITTLANGGTAVTGSGTTFTAAMVGRWFKTDDGNWYRISAYTSATAITLQMPYQGTAISAGTSTFTIGEIPRIPEGTHDLPVYFALWQHYQGIRRDPKLAIYYKSLWEQGIKWAIENFGSRYSSAVIPSQRAKRRQMFKDPNNWPDLSSA